MEFLTSSAGSILSALPPFLLVLTIVVFFHELGHYLVGRWCGIKAEVFSVGFGPELFGRTDRHGTRWKVSLIPLGGYVKFLGDENAASQPSGSGAPALSAAERAQSFPNAALWRRAATVAAGPIANFILAIAIFSVTFGINGRMISDPVVASVQPASAAEAAGILAGDRFVAIDGIEVEIFDDVQRYVSVRPEVPMTLTMDRNGELVDLTLTPVRTEIADNFGNKMEVGRIGVVTDTDAGNFRVREYGPIEAVGEGVAQSWYIVTRTVGYLGNIISGREKPDQLGGPIRVAKYSKDMSTLGIMALIQLAAVLSVSIGLLNLMPVPMLDGGHLVFYAIEAVRGRPPGEVAQEWAYRFGLSIVLALMIFATWNDVTMLIG
ncbi:MAG: RIP metalloprotease RseP [Hoeflea sp.]|uniref:RIP metalloprotease RseP n=1 Tax=Hoeflea sp. TaxID=1940281 RepID=UPI001DB6C9C2|nr:RIP metalloprotease RseP [Hoeflea sp.]MBU4529648.1 RIP metalloprotease RseP [Alphaproteobacteria bacterium]MBU4546767.1 RIP metalloprotease RseP [Alphaproteobacteria bacterium]MBU4551035.1 RIP metalloprotease RseP [Alphaproteobacteria bacterium]MBV1723977.1 RIP metalloprotease RseP [Hoeflea sp.]MBV1763254.1 RIP metalloprotease RseP [Hoeflea sp.]